MMSLAETSGFRSPLAGADALALAKTAGCKAGGMRSHPKARLKQPADKEREGGDCKEGVHAGGHEGVAEIVLRGFEMRYDATGKPRVSFPSCLECSRSRVITFLCQRM